MASATTDTSEQDSPNPSEEQNGPAKPEGLRAPEQEPAESECGKMDENGELDEEKRAATDESEETPSNDEGLSRDGDEEKDKDMDTEADMLVQKGVGSAGSSADVTGELRQEQREEENASSPLHCAVRKAEDKPGTEIKRRASVEISSSDGEPLSRIDSEDRSVHPLLTHSLTTPLPLTPERIRQVTPHTLGPSGALCNTPPGGPPSLPTCSVPAVPSARLPLILSSFFTLLGCFRHTSLLYIYLQVKSCDSTGHGHVGEADHHAERQGVVFGL